MTTRRDGRQSADERRAMQDLTTRDKTNAMILLLLLALLLTSSHSGAFNVDTQSPVVHQGPAGSYFGYTVAQHRDRGANWLLVGAPKAQTDQPKTVEAGAVYRCTTNNVNACQQIPFDHNGSSSIQLAGLRNQTDEKSHQWFGASLQSANDNGSIVACAPRYVYFSTNLRRRDPVGTCWVSRGSFSGFLEYSPCRLNDQWGHHHLGSCQAGFSSAITKDGSRLFMGAPGSHVWQGQVFAHNLRTDLANATSAVNPRYEDDSYLGYSLALGRFSDQSQASSAENSDLAIGIPRGADLQGKVMLVDSRMRLLRNLTGEQMGAYFGYSLATLDLNGDQLDDLVVGAPLYYNQTTSHKEAHYERGRVYVYTQNLRRELNLQTTIDGIRNRARFGLALANCGDLNRDGYQDLAVGAPYDGPDNRGAVYIFMGRKSGLAQEPDQVIMAESVRGEGHLLRSFGFSLSAGQDMDGNNYPDLLIGDYQADRAVLLRARPVINVSASLTFQPEHFNLDDKTCLLPNSTTSVSCITVQYCIRYSGLNVDQRTNFVFDIKLDTENKGNPRLFFLGGPEANRNEDRNSSMLTKDVQQCRSFKTYIVRQIRDKLTPLRVEVEYNLADYAAPSSDFYAGKLRPVLSRPSPGQSSNKLSKAATIQKNCGSDNLCVPDLKLTVNPNLDQYTIGSNERLVLDVTVKNYGEEAYESMFYLTMPMAINFITINKTRTDYPICYGAKPDQTGVNVLTCDLGNPQQRNDVVKFSVVTEPARGVQTASDFTFVATVNSTNPELDDRHREDNQVAIGIPIKVKVDLVLSGSSNPPRVVHNSTSSLLLANPLTGQRSAQTMSRPLLVETDIGPEVYHVYQLQNKGPSTINDIALTILWPTQNKDGKWLLYLLDEPFTNEKVRCKPAPDDAINPLKLNARSIAASSGLDRSKRQATSELPTTTVDNSVLQQLNLLDCGPTQCTRFECNAVDLGFNELATIKIRSRLNEETLNSLKLQEFDISSKLVAQVKSLPYNVSSQSMPPYVYVVETQVHTTGISVQEFLPWWLILLAILLGILLFILLACFLKYLGFFARRRPPKGAEREPLTPTLWNDYQYTPGDTAL